VHFDSITEAEELLDIAVRDGWRVGLRCHVPAEHDRKEPGFGGQFGLASDEVLHLAARLESAGVPVEGMHFHLGQGHRRPGDYGDSVDYVIALCLEAGLRPRYIDCGGGLEDDAELEATLADLDAAIARARRSLPSVQEIWLENGRYLTERSAALVVRVLDIKVRPDCRYLICDGGRTNQALDADNGIHPILVAPQRDGHPVLTTIAGPTCMTDDRLGRVDLPSDIERGDLLVWLDAGAYHLPWETRFSRGLCAVAWADGTDSLSLARAAETPDTWSLSWRE
jgi:diaminopimelate decarboxylase